MMKHSRKLLSLLLAVLMLLGMMQTAALAEGGAVITLTSDAEGSLQPGDTFTVTASIANNPGFIAAQFNIAFNKEALAVEAFNVGRQDAFYFGEYKVNNDAAYGAFITFASDEMYDETTGNLFSMTFKVMEGAAEGEYPIAINATADNHLLVAQETPGSTEFTNVAASYVPVTVTVGSAAAEPEIMLGDANGNGEITSADAALTYAVANNKKQPESDAQFAAMDANKNGEITSADAALIYAAANNKRELK